MYEMIENGKISIIVPMFNCAEYAPQCIDNILSQSYKNWELWLIHGDSSDGTEQICQKYEEKDERIHNIYHIDGLVPARNVGYEHATGDWIMYIDGDDWIDGDCLVEIMEAAKRYDNPDVVFWKFVQDMDGKVIEGKWAFKNESHEQLYVDDECKELACQAMDYTNGIGESFAKIARMDYCKKYALHQNKNLRQGMEGYEYTLRLYYQASRILFLNKDYNHYRYNNGSLSKMVSEKNAICIHESAVEMENFIKLMPDGIIKDRIYKVFYKRSLYALLSVVMSTYFHPRNKDSFWKKRKVFKKAMSNFYVFSDSLRYADESDFDIKRRVAIFCLKHHLYYMLAFISRVKVYMDSNGKFNY